MVRAALDSVNKSKEGQTAYANAVLGSGCSTPVDVETNPAEETLAQEVSEYGLDEDFSWKIAAYGQTIPLSPRDCCMETTDFNANPLSPFFFHQTNVRVIGTENEAPLQRVQTDPIGTQRKKIQVAPRRTRVDPRTHKVIWLHNRATVLNRTYCTLLSLRDWDDIMKNQGRYNTTWRHGQGSNYDQQMQNATDPTVPDYAGHKSKSPSRLEKIIFAKYPTIKDIDWTALAKYINNGIGHVQPQDKLYGSDLAYDSPAQSHQRPCEAIPQYFDEMVMLDPDAWKEMVQTMYSGSALRAGCHALIMDYAATLMLVRKSLLPETKDYIAVDNKWWTWFVRAYLHDTLLQKIAPDLLNNSSSGSAKNREHIGNIMEWSIGRAMDLGFWQWSDMIMFMSPIFLSYFL